MESRLTEDDNAALPTAEQTPLEKYELQPATRRPSTQSVSTSLGLDFKARKDIEYKSLSPRSSLQMRKVNHYAVSRRRI